MGVYFHCSGFGIFFSILQSDPSRVAGISVACLGVFLSGTLVKIDELGSDLEWLTYFSHGRWFAEIFLLLEYEEYPDHWQSYVSTVLNVFSYKTSDLEVAPWWLLGIGLG